MKHPGRINRTEILIVLLLCTSSLLFYGVLYNQHLYQREQVQLFEFSADYLLQKLSLHGGLADYTGEFLTQFFSVPFAGAAIISALCLLLYFVNRKIIAEITGKEPMSVITLIPSSGYFILLADNFYPLAGLVAFIMAPAAALFCIRIKRPGLRGAAQIALIPFVYWATGGAYLVFVSLVIINEIILRTHPGRQHVSYRILPVIIVFALILPLLAREYLFKDTLLQAYLSGSFYRIPVFLPFPIALLFLSFPLLVAAQYYLPGAGKLKDFPVLNLISGVSFPAFVITGGLLSADFKAESVMKYENLAYNEKWAVIVKKAEKELPRDPVSLAAVNLAMAKTASLSEKMFLYDQNPNSLFVNYERKGMTPFIASEPYYHLGLYNFSQMFAMETVESTPDAKFPARSFKRVAETFLINGQFGIALKYLRPLGRTIFYRRWAEKYIRLIETGEIENDEWLTGKRKLMTNYDFYYDPARADVALIYLLISDPENKTAFEYLMAHYLLNKDLDGFLTGLAIAGNMGYHSLPAAWQEAVAYIGTRVGQVPSLPGSFEIGSDVISRLKSYATDFSAESPDTDEIRRLFGNTYWYYLHFK